MAAPFSPQLFLTDVRKLCTTFGAPYCDSTTLTVLETYAPSFRRGAVLWRITDRESDGLNYRFYEREPVNLVGLAISGGLLCDNHPLIPLLNSWSSLYATTEQSCDFDTEVGLTKIWVYLGGMRPLGDILNAPHVPESIRGLKPAFDELGLKLVRHVAVDFRSLTVNIYFRAVGPLSLDRANSLLALSGSPCLSEKKVMEMTKFMNPKGFTFAVTVKVDSGEIKRVGIYALRLSPGNFPDIGDRLQKFFKEAKSYDEEMNAIAWSFGAKNSGTYVKAERNYCGGLVELMKRWNSVMTVE